MVFGGQGVEQHDAGLLYKKEDVDARIPSHAETIAGSWSTTRCPEAYTRADLSDAWAAERADLRAKLEWTEKERNAILRLSVVTIKSLETVVSEWKEAATRHHSNPGDHRYWEGRYRDEKAENERLREEFTNACDCIDYMTGDVRHTADYRAALEENADG